VGTSISSPCAISSSSGGRTGASSPSKESTSGFVWLFCLGEENGEGGKGGCSGAARCDNASACISHTPHTPAAQPGGGSSARRQLEKQATTLHEVSDKGDQSIRRTPLCRSGGARHFFRQAVAAGEMGGATSAASAIAKPSLARPLLQKPRGPSANCLRQLVPFQKNSENLE